MARSIRLFPAPPDPSGLRDGLDRLRLQDVGEVRLSPHDRQIYATDASNYSVEPLAVVICRSTDQISRLLAFCHEHKLPLLPRGGGTSLAGQCTNRAIVLDMSNHFRRIISIDAAGRRCHVEAGITIDAINQHLKAAGCELIFAPDPATVSQASIGGCVGNNAAGARSIRYGRTSENLASLDVLLADGTALRLEAGAGRRHPRAAQLAEAVANVVLEYRASIRERFPQLNRRNAGYALDMILDQLAAGCPAQDLDLTCLICGSEGTLAVVTAATLKLQPAPRSRRLILLTFASVDDAIAAVAALLQTNPSAVELLDDVVLKAAGLNARTEPILTALGIHAATSGTNPSEARAILFVEFQNEGAATDAGDPPGWNAVVADLAGLLSVSAPGADVQADAWLLRRSAEALLHALSADAKPVTFIEDNSIPVENLSRFVCGVRDIVAAHGTTCAYYAHASVGVLHVRPLLNLHQSADRRAMVQIAVEVARLARSLGGVMSGEHGDGRVRGPLLAEFFGPEIMAAFARVKAVFDPLGILNPGMITQSGDVESIAQNLRIDQTPAANGAGLDPVMDYQAQGGLIGAVEMCNGAGFCRKLDSGTMCPSFRATLDERHSPRGRANALRFAFLNPGGKPRLSDAATLETLDLCLSCKACKTECPSNVDISKLKAEYLAASWRHDRHVPMAVAAVGHIRAVNQVGSVWPGLANAVACAPPLRRFVLPHMGITSQRPLPRFDHSLKKKLSRLRDGGPGRARWISGRQVDDGMAWDTAGPISDGAMGRVILVVDCFTGFTESGIAMAAVRLLRNIGCEVLVADAGCCGRSMISVGMLTQARAAARRTCRRLCALARAAEPTAILFLEPSCQSAAVDDWKELLEKTDLNALAALPPVMSVESFVAQHLEKIPVAAAAATAAPAAGRLMYHGHCHQKALWGQQSMIDIFNHIAPHRSSILPTGCCGMAGSFGYGVKRYAVSQAIFEAPEFDAVRSAGPADILLASGCSCREQIRHFAHRAPLHPVEWLDRLLAPATDLRP